MNEQICDALYFYLEVNVHPFKDGKGAGALALWGDTEGTALIQSGDSFGDI